MTCDKKMSREYTPVIFLYCLKNRQKLWGAGAKLRGQACEGTERVGDWRAVGQHRKHGSLRNGSPSFEREYRKARKSEKWYLLC
jgi:hypothetical protein